MLAWWVPALARGSRRAPLSAPTPWHVPPSPPSGLGSGGCTIREESWRGCEGPWGTRLGSALARPLLPLSQTFISVAPAAPGGAVGCSAGTPNCQHLTPRTASTSTLPVPQHRTPQISAPTAPRHPKLPACWYPSNSPAPQPCLNPGTPNFEHPGTPKCPELPGQTPPPYQHSGTPAMSVPLHPSAQPCTRRRSSLCAPVGSSPCPLPNPLRPPEPPPRPPAPHGSPNPSP